jgi:hypothetical protein
MATLVRYSRLDLPVFEPGIPIARTKDDIKSAVNEGRPTVVRTMALQGSVLGATTLRGTLAATDGMFEDIAGACNALVPSHQWGLVEISDQSQMSRRRHNLLPRGFNLAAEVEVIVPTHPLTDDQTVMIVSGISQHIDEDPPIQWKDAHPDQFMNGVSKSHSLLESNLWLIDIEPRVL